MKTTSKTGVATPTVNVSVAKNRLKVYNKDSQTPTIYLEKDAEFEIELFNPTTDVIVAEIILNDKPISQGGLVLRQGERVFLERYLDVAKRFKFETYIVSNTKEVQAAIKDNGTLKVKFYREDTTPKYKPYDNSTITVTPPYNGGWAYTSSAGDVVNAVCGGDNITGAMMNNDTSSFNVQSMNINATTMNYSADVIQPVDASDMKFAALGDKFKRKRTVNKKRKTETGVVAEGSNSDQKFQDVQKKWEYFPFATIELKLMPTSTKEISVAEVGNRRYCTNCGTKAKSNFKFCPTCGTKV